MRRFLAILVLALGLFETAAPIAVAAVCCAEEEEAGRSGGSESCEEECHDCLCCPRSPLPAVASPLMGSPAVHRVVSVLAVDSIDPADEILHVPISGA